MCYMTTTTTVYTVLASLVVKPSSTKSNSQLSNQLEIFANVVQRTHRSSAICIVNASKLFAVAKRMRCSILSQ